MDNLKKSALVATFFLVPVFILLYLGAFALTIIYDISYLELFKKPDFLLMIALGAAALIWSIRLIVTPVVIKPSDFQPIIKSQRGRNIAAFSIILFMLGVFYFVAGGEETIRMAVKILIIITPIVIIHYLIRRFLS